MKTVRNIGLILGIAVAVGLLLRVSNAKRPGTTDTASQPVFYSNENAVSDNQNLRPEDVANDTPSKPPEDEDWLSRFELTERSGQTVTSEDLKGTPYVVSFFFSTCPASCIRQNQIVRSLQETFSGQGVRFVSISVDPETDRPEVLREYATRFGADEQQWLFMTGELDYIRRVGGEIFMQPVNKKFHTDRFALVDAEGRIEGFYNWPEERQLEAMKKSIRAMLRDAS